MVNIDLNELAECSDGARALVQLIITADISADVEIKKMPPEVRGDAELQRRIRSIYIVRAVCRIIKELA